MKVKPFLEVTLGSLFIQIFAWAMYSVLEMNVWFCGLSVVVTALLYHFLQKEQNTGLSRKCVFFAGILIPFLLALIVTAAGLIRHPNLMLLSASLDGVSPLTEVIALYATRLLLNGVVLMVFAWVDRTFLQGEEQTDEK